MPTLTFSPQAWLKILYMKNSADTEVSGFGISKADNPLYVEDFITVKQECTAVTTDMDEQALDKYLEEMEEVRGLPISSFYRIWIHTHPNMSPSPSGTDEENFSTMFKSCTWAIMVIVGKDEEVYARLQLNKVDVVSRLEMELNTEVDWMSLSADLQESWQTELKENIKKKVWASPGSVYSRSNWGNMYSNSRHWRNSAAAAQRQTSLVEEYEEANEAILAELDEEQKKTNNQANQVVGPMRFLKGKLKKIVDRMDDFDKTILIDEIDEHYDLSYLTGQIEDPEDFSVERFTGREEESESKA